MTNAHQDISRIQDLDVTRGISRRRLLGMAVAGGAAACFGSLRVARAKAEDFGGFAIGLQTYTFRAFPVDKMLDTAKELGFETLEFFPGHYSLKSTPDDIAAMKKKLAAHNLKALGHGVSPFTKDHEANRKIFEFAKQAGIRNISADPTPDSFDSLDKLVAEYGVRVAIHNHGPGARYDKIADVLNAIKGHHPEIGACADLGHYIRAGEDPVKAITLFEGRLYGVHLKDFDQPKKDAKGVVLGKGQLDLDATFRALRKVKFPADACLALEYEENSENPTDDVRQCVAAAAASARKTKA
ncbi:MAG TPA: sugar phosphate isomerase/epimerase [Pirellulales bacterium]|jgi:sugar phosphate isomerase/epimerase